MNRVMWRGGKKHSQKTVLEKPIYSKCNGRFYSVYSGRCFDLISLKLDRTAVPIENWSCVVFGPNQPNEGSPGGYANSRIF